MEITKEQLKEILKECIQPKEPKLTLTIDEATKLSGIGRDKLLELVHSENSNFPSFKVGSKFLINRQMLINWLERITLEKKQL